MILFLHLKRLFLKHIVELRWYSALGVALGYIIISWALLKASGESDLIQLDTFFYWLLVTASTVGYGDFSPSTTTGKWVVALFVIPFGLSLFALVVGNLATLFAEQWRKGVKGLKQLDVENHILIIGWNGPRTLHLIKLILREQEHDPNPPPIVLCVMADIENPMVDKICFVKVSSFNNDAEMSRTNIEKAKCIILDNEQDDVTMTTALYSYGRNPHAHTIAYFKDESLVSLLKKHCPNIECTPSVAVEMLAKAATDPGSSRLHHELLDVDSGMTQYSVVYPENQPSKPLEAFFSLFKTRYHATLIGVASKSSDTLVINPELNFVVSPGSVLYYIADERVTNFDWSKCHV